MDMTNYERILNLSLDDMCKFLDSIYQDGYKDGYLDGKSKSLTNKWFSRYGLDWLKSSTNSK